MYMYIYIYLYANALLPNENTPPIVLLGEYAGR